MWTEKSNLIELITSWYLMTLAYWSGETDITPVAAHYRLHHIVSFRHRWGHLQSHIYRLSAATRQSGCSACEGTRLTQQAQWGRFNTAVVPFPYEGKAEEGEVGHLSVHDGNEAALVQRDERNAAGGRKERQRRLSVHRYHLLDIQQWRHVGCCTAVGSQPCCDKSVYAC